MNKKLIELGNYIKSIDSLPNNLKVPALCKQIHTMDLDLNLWDSLTQEEQDLLAEVSAIIKVDLYLSYRSEYIWTQEQRDKYCFGKTISYCWDELETIIPELLGESPIKTQERDYAEIVNSFNNFP